MTKPKMWKNGRSAKFDDSIPASLSSSIMLTCVDGGIRESISTPCCVLKTDLLTRLVLTDQRRVLVNDINIGDGRGVSVDHTLEEKRQK